MLSADDGLARRPRTPGPFLHAHPSPAAPCNGRTRAPGEDHQAGGRSAGRGRAGAVAAAPAGAVAGRAGTSTTLAGAGAVDVALAAEVLVRAPVQTVACEFAVRLPRLAAGRGVPASVADGREMAVDRPARARLRLRARNGPSGVRIIVRRLKCFRRGLPGCPGVSAGHRLSAMRVTG